MTSSISYWNKKRAMERQKKVKKNPDALTFRIQIFSEKITFKTKQHRGPVLGSMLLQIFTDASTGKPCRGHRLDPGRRRKNDVHQHLSDTSQLRPQLHLIYRGWLNHAPGPLQSFYSGTDITGIWRWVYVPLLADPANILTCANTGLGHAIRLRTVYPLSPDVQIQTRGPYLFFQNPGCRPKHPLKSGPPHRRFLLVGNNVRLMGWDWLKVF